MRKLVILGHTGFVGRALQAHLQREPGAQVMGCSSRTMDLRRAESVRGLEAFVDRDTVVIFAAAITREKSDTLETLLDNIAMAGHVGEFLESHPPAKCVVLSSDAVYPVSPAPLTEETPVAPGGTSYAIAKYTTECVLRRSAEAKGIPLLILRPTGVFGPGDTHNSYGPNAFVRAAIGERSVRVFGDGEDRRDHLFIGDLVRLIARLIITDAVGVYNLASGASPSFMEVVERLRRVVPFTFEVTHAPRKAPLVHRHFDITRLSRQVPDFQFTDLQLGLRDTFVSFAAASVKT